MRPLKRSNFLNNRAVHTLMKLCIRFTYKIERIRKFHNLCISMNFFFPWKNEKKKNLEQKVHIIMESIIIYTFEKLPMTVPIKNMSHQNFRFIEFERIDLLALMENQFLRSLRFFFRSFYFFFIENHRENLLNLHSSWDLHSKVI